MAKTRKINILGTEYTLETDVAEKDDKELLMADGYCDRSTKRLVVAGKPENCTIGDFGNYQRGVIRHEIIHAFLFESGFDANSAWGLQDGENHPEQMVQWLSIMFPKLVKAFEECGAMETGV